MSNNTGWWLDEYDGPRFWQYVDRNGGTEHTLDPLSTAEGECWNWLGAKDKGGYGRFRMGRKNFLSHRIAYLDGSRSSRIPEDWVVDHLCRNHSCVRPEHLEAVEFVTNVERGSRGKAARTHCPSGHEYTEANTKLVPRGAREIRTCRLCYKASAQRTYQRRKQAA